MKEIRAVVQPFMVQHVCDALAAIPGLPGLTISDVHGWGKTRGKGARRARMEGGHAFAEKAQIEIVVPDGLVRTVVDAVVKAARTGAEGDGKVFIRTIDDVVKIRTGETGERAI